MYYILVEKNQVLLSVDVTFEIVKVQTNFGIKISTCKFNQLVPNKIFMAFLNQFVVHLNSSKSDGKYFKLPVSFFYFFQVIEMESEIDILRLDDVLEVQFIQGLLILLLQFIIINILDSFVQFILWVNLTYHNIYSTYYILQIIV